MFGITGITQCLNVNFPSQLNLMQLNSKAYKNLPNKAILKTYYDRIKLNSS